MSESGFYDTINLDKFKRDPGGTILKKQPRISIDKKDGRILLNRAFVREGGLHKFDYAQFYYQPDDQIILIEFYEQEPSKSARRVVWAHDGNSAHVRTASFLNHFNIDRNQIAGFYTPYKKTKSTGGTIYKIDIKDNDPLQPSYAC